MNALLETGLVNAAQAAVLAVAVYVVTRTWWNAQVAHLLWLLVLVKLILPPVYYVNVPIPRLGEMSRWRNGLMVEDGTGSNPVQSLVAKNGEPLSIDSDGSFPVEPVGSILAESSPRGDSLAAVNMPIDVGGASSRQPTEIEPSESPAAAPAAEIRPTAETVILTIWIAGSCLWMLVVARRIRVFSRLVRQTLPASHELHQVAAQMSRELGMHRCPEVRLVEAKVPPMVWSARRPIVLLPVRLLETLDFEQQASLLAHELAHVRRKDHWIRWFEMAVLALYWWNPVAWWARSQLQTAEEECCDGWVVSLMRERSRHYATALFETLDWLSRSREPLPLLGSGIGYVDSLKRRFEMIVRQKTRRSMSWTGRLLVLLLALVVLPLAARFDASAQEAAKPDVTRPEIADEEPLDDLFATPKSSSTGRSFGLFDSRQVQAKVSERVDSANDADELLEQRLDRLEKIVMELASVVKASSSNRKKSVLRSDPLTTRDARQQQQLAKKAAAQASAFDPAFQYRPKSPLDKRFSSAMGIRQLQRQKEELENQYRMKELDVRKIHLELKYMKKQLEEISSQIDRITGSNSTDSDPFAADN